MKKIKYFGNLTITAYVKFKAQSITINNLSPKKKRKGKDKQNTFIQMVVKNGSKKWQNDWFCFFGCGVSVLFLTRDYCREGIVKRRDKAEQMGPENEQSREGMWQKNKQHQKLE